MAQLQMLPKCSDMNATLAVKHYLHKEGTREQLDATRNMILEMKGVIDRPLVNLALAVVHERMRSYGFAEYIGNELSYLPPMPGGSAVPMVNPALSEQEFREAALLSLTLMRYSLHVERHDEKPSDNLDEVRTRIRTLRFANARVTQG